MEEGSVSVDGFRFLTEEDAAAARTDQARVEQLSRYLERSGRSKVRALYEKSLENGVFATPVGWSFLRALRGEILAQGEDLEDLPEIPVQVSITRRRLPGDYRVPERIRETPRAREPVPLSFTTSLAMNLVLAVLIIVMFFIASTSRSDNILNYRRNVTSEYASWAEELSAREREVRERERALGIEDAAASPDARGPGG